MQRYHIKKGFTLIELLIVISIIALLSATIFGSLNSSRSNARDDRRISDIRQIRYALELYYNDFNNYPTCLTMSGGCVTALQNSRYMTAIPKDPLTGLSYSYAALGSGSICSSFHLGTSMENKHSAFMTTGIDASVQPICTGSAADFSGLSYAAGGQPCNTTAGTAQPTNAVNGETCHDVGP